MGLIECYCLTQYYREPREGKENARARSLPEVDGEAKAAKAEHAR